MSLFTAFLIGCSIGVVILMAWILNTDGDWE